MKFAEKREQCASIATTAHCVLRADPTIVTRVCDDDGRLPLHYACIFKALHKAIVAIPDAYPQAIFEKNDELLLPLHYALFPDGRGESSASVETLQLRSTIRKAGGALTRFFGGEQHCLPLPDVRRSTMLGAEDRGIAGDRTRCLTW